MTPLEKIQSMKMPFAELKGVTFVEADRDRVVARMQVRPDLCTLNHIIHGGAIMALADSVGAAATVINLPEEGGDDPDRHGNAGSSRPAHASLADSAGD